MKNIYKIIFVLIFQLIINQQSFSQQAPGIEWQNTIGGNIIDQLDAIKQTVNGGFILGGTSNSSISGDKTENSLGDIDYWVVKIDSLGSIEWQNTIGGNSQDWLQAIGTTLDGGFILGGSSYSGISGDKTEYPLGLYDYWIIKIDSIGNIQWQNTIGGNANDNLFSVLQTTDGGYILGGMSDSNISGDKTEDNKGGADYWIVKLNSFGNIIWQKTIGGDDADWLYSIQMTVDGGYVLGGMSASDISGDKTENNIGLTDYWTVKLDSLGNILWQNTIGGDSTDILYSIEQTFDHGYILGGESMSNVSGDKTEPCLGGYDYWVVKLDSLGNIQWQNTIGGNDWDIPRSVLETIDGDYFFAGESNSNISGDKTENSNGGWDCWVLKLDSSGNILWQNTVGGSVDDGARSMCLSNEGSCVIGANSYSNISGDKTENCIGPGYSDYWIIKLAPDNITGISPTQSTLGGEGVAIAPNPLVTQSTLTFTNPRKEKFLFTLYDITGRIISPPERGQGCVVTTSNEIIINKGSKQAGLYLFSLRNEKTGEVMNGKIVIQ